jgi:hypothetical protein
MKDVASAAYTILCLLLSVVFLFATMLSVMVALGLVADNPLAGVFCAVVFWLATSKYRKIFIERVQDVQKSIKPPDDNDDTSDNSF